MARTPNPPDISNRQTLLGRVVYLAIGFPLALWVFWQFFWMWWVFFGWMLDNVIGQGASEFMYDDLREFWDKWKYQIMPWWFFHIPTWRDWYAWPIIALLVYLRFGGRLPRFKRERKPKFADPPPKDSPYTRKKQDKSQQRQSAGSSDDEFGFDPNAFKGGNGQQKQEPPRDKPKPDDKLKEALELFELELPFTLDDLKKRRKQLLAKTHPDAGGSGFLFKQVENAFGILKKKAR